MSFSEQDVRAAFKVADQDSPLPSVARDALQILKTEVLYRWEQRTALSFRLQALRDALAGSGLDPMSELYVAMHELLATAEGWMHPDTLGDAVKAHIDLLERRNRDLVRQLQKHRQEAEARQVVDRG